METIYYHLDARRVSVQGMASGEAVPHCRSYAVLRKTEEKCSAAPGKVLDLEAYRRRLSLAEEAEVELTISEPAPKPHGERTHRFHRRAFLALDCFATLAILVMTVVVVMGFLPLL